MVPCFSQRSWRIGALGCDGFEPPKERFKQSSGLFGVIEAFLVRCRSIRGLGYFIRVRRILFIEITGSRACPSSKRGGKRWRRDGLSVLHKLQKSRKFVPHLER